MVILCLNDSNERSCKKKEALSFGHLSIDCIRRCGTLEALQLVQIFLDPV